MTEAKVAASRSPEFDRHKLKPVGGNSPLVWVPLMVVWGAVLGAFAFGYNALHPQWALLLILLVLAPFTSLVLGGVERYLVAVIIFDIPFQVDIFLGRDTREELFALQGYIFSATTIALVLLYGLWAMESVVVRRQRKGGALESPVTRWLLAYMGAVVLSLTAARDLRLSGYELFLLAQMFLVFLYLAARLNERAEILFIVRILMIATLVQGLVMLAVRLLGGSIEIAGLEAVISGGRVAGTLGSFNRAASYLNLGLALALGVLLSSRASFDKWLALAVVAVGGPALVFTLSRGGWLGFLTALTVLLFVTWRRSRLSPWVPVLVTLGLLALFLSFQEPIRARIEGRNASDPETRLALMRMASFIIADQPVLGVGANNYGAVIDEYSTPEFAGYGLHQVHNKYLLVWAETGILGLIAFLAFLVTTVRVGLGTWRRYDSDLAYVVLGLTAGVLAQMVQMPTERFASRPQIQLIWVAAAIVVAVNRLLRPAGTAKPTAASPGAELR